jgi:hypothetical protein
MFVLIPGLFNDFPQLHNICSSNTLFRKLRVNIPRIYFLHFFHFIHRAVKVVSKDLGQSVSFGIKELPRLNYICADVNMETLVYARTYLSILTCTVQLLIRKTAQNGQLESRHMGLGEKKCSTAILCPFLFTNARIHIL